MPRLGSSSLTVETVDRSYPLPRGQAENPRLGTMDGGREETRPERRDWDPMRWRPSSMSWVESSGTSRTENSTVRWLKKDGKAALGALIGHEGGLAMRRMDRAANRIGHALVGDPGN